MSGKNSLEDKNIITGIKNSLFKNSKFMYYDNMEFKASKDVTEVRAESLEFKSAIGTYFDIGDYFILKEVHSLGITNVSTMLKRLVIEKKRCPEKEYPLYDYNKLMGRMRYLVRQGLLFSFEFIDTYNRNMFVFCCTMYGWRLYKNKLQSPDLFDKNMVFRAETELFKRLASHSVAYAFAYSPLCTSVIINETISYDNNKHGYIYARATLGEENKALYVVEPVYFNVDSRRISESENEAQITRRLSQMEEIITYLKSNNSSVKLILCVENYDGLKKLLNIIKSKDASFYCENCYFTSENVLFESKDVLSRSFLQLSMDSGSYKFSLAKDTWF